MLSLIISGPAGGGRKIADMVVIVTTADPSCEVMQSFSESLRRFADLGTRVRWIVVDALRLYGETPDCIQHLCRERVVLEWVKPEKRLDQVEAIILGLSYSGMGPVVVMDPDMSENIADIPCFLKEYEHGAHVVFGWRKTRLGMPWVRIVMTDIYNSIARWLTGFSLHDLNSPMILLSFEACNTVLGKCPGHVSRRFYMYEHYRSSLGEVCITTRETPGKKSAYPLPRLLSVGVLRLWELQQFVWWRISISD